MKTLGTTVLAACFGMLITGGLVAFAATVPATQPQSAEDFVAGMLEQHHTEATRGVTIVDAVASNLGDH